jgi:hypothetical protein
MVRPTINTNIRVGLGCCARLTSSLDKTIKENVKKDNKDDNKGNKIHDINCICQNCFIHDINCVCQNCTIKPKKRGRPSACKSLI